MEGYQAGYGEGEVLVGSGSAAERSCVETVIDGECLSRFRVSGMVVDGLQVGLLEPKFRPGATKTLPEKAPKTKA